MKWLSDFMEENWRGDEECGGVDVTAVLLSDGWHEVLWIKHNPDANRISSFMVWQEEGRFQFQDDEKRYVTGPITGIVALRQPSYGP